MNVSERIALGLVIDLSRAIVDNPMHINGIEESAALKITRFREASVPFKKVLDLTKIFRIRQKQLKRWERFFICRVSGRESSLGGY